MSQQIRIGMGIEPTDAFWLQIIETIYQRSQEHSTELVGIYNSVSLQTSSDEQNALLEDIISQELDVWMGWHFPETLAHQMLNMGLPIVQLSETHIDHPLIVSPLGLRKIAEELAHYTAGLIGNEGEILTIGGLLQGTLPDDGRSRLAGVTAASGDYPKIRFQHIPTHWGEEQARHELRKALRDRQTPVDALLGFSDMLALVGREVLLEYGLCDEQTPVVGINGDPSALAAIIEGRMRATIETSATHLANQAFDIALDIVYGQPYPAHYDYNPRLITAENVAKVAAEKLVTIANIPYRLIGSDHQRLDEYQNYLETSLDISRQIGSVLNSERLPIELATLIRWHFGYDHVQLFSWSEHDQMLTLVTHEDTQPKLRIPVLNAGVLGEALTREKPVFIPDAHHSFRYARDPMWPETRSRIILPIRQGGKITGLLDLHATRLVRATRQQLLGLQSLADQLGVAMQNSALYQEAIYAKVSAEKADQLKTRLLANISHDLRSPLHVILNYVEKLYNASHSDDALQQIEKNADHLLRLINDLLDLSRAEIDELSIAPEFIDPVSLLRDVFDGMRESAGEGAPLRWHLEVSDYLPMIQADPDRLRQMLYNLLSNARKFTTRGQITLSADVESPYLHIWVQDTGVGISPQHQQHIFEPFVSMYENGNRKGGVGLGLSITQRLVALHHGLITVDSQLAKGSTFHIYLPLPNLSNAASLVPTESLQPVVLMVSERRDLPQELVSYWQRRKLEICLIQTERDIDDMLSRGLPALIAWDTRAANESEWQIIQRLRSNPELCGLPFLLYGQSEAVPSQASVLLKPVKPKTLLNILGTFFKDDENGSILIVDDDPEARRLYEEIITGQISGYNCLSAGDGKEAVAIMENLVPRLVILDLAMPEMDGFEVIQWMRSKPRIRHVPVIVMSGKILTFEDIKRLEPYQKITYQSKNVLSETELASSLQQILFDSHTLPAQTSVVVKHALAYIHQNYPMPLSRSEIAHQLGVSKNYLTQIFHQELGISLWDYLNRYRVMQAKELLRQTDHSIASISSQVGFDDPAYFSRVFRRYVGQSPRIFRNAAS